jgi:hypothetical protein
VISPRAAVLAFAGAQRFAFACLVPIGILALLIRSNDAYCGDLTPRKVEGAGTNSD